MPTVDVSGNSPGSGPGFMNANATRDIINEDHVTWLVIVAWTADNTRFTSATANGPSLQAAVEKLLPGYLYHTY